MKEQIDQLRDMNEKKRIILDILNDNLSLENVKKLYEINAEILSIEAKIITILTFNYKWYEH